MLRALGLRRVLAVSNHELRLSHSRGFCATSAVLSMRGKGGYSYATSIGKEHKRNKALDKRERKDKWQKSKKERERKAPKKAPRQTKQKKKDYVQTQAKDGEDEFLYSPDQSETIREESVRRESVRRESVRREPVRKDPVRKEPITKEPVQKEAVRHDEPDYHQGTEIVVQELRQQKKEGATTGKNLLMKRAKMRRAAPDDKGEMFKDRFAHFTPEEKLTEQVYLPFGGGKALEEHPRACAATLCNNSKEMNTLHLEAEHTADVYVSFLKDLVAQSTVSKHFVDEGQTYAFYNTIKMLKDTLTNLDYVFRTPGFKNPLLSKHHKQPPFLLAQPKHSDPRKPTVLVHAHYDSVANNESGWEHDPLTMGRKDGRLTGRGVSSKSAVAAWVCAVATMKHAKIPSSVNVKFCFDPFGELGNAGLEECLLRENTGFFHNISAVVVSQGQWMTDTQPNIIYGQRGVHNYYLNIKGGEKRVDAGKYGGLVQEPLIELTQLMSHLTSIDQTELFPRQKEPKPSLNVADVCKEEAKMIDELDLSIEDLQRMTGVAELKTDDKTAAIQKIWRQPAVSINSIKSGYEPEEEYQTTIPKHATARFSIRTVPNMRMDAVDILVKKYFFHLHRSMHSTNELSIRRLSQYPWWLSSRDHWNYDTAQKAIKSVWKVKPEFTREGGTSPAAVLFEKHLRTNVLVLPIGKPSDEPRTIHENFDEVHYINAIKTFCSYMLFAGEMASSSDKFIVAGSNPKKVEKVKESKLAGLIPVKDETAVKEEPGIQEPKDSSLKNPQMDSVKFALMAAKKKPEYYQMKLDIDNDTREEKGEKDQKKDQKRDQKNGEKVVKEREDKTKESKDKDFS